MSSKFFFLKTYSETMFVKNYINNVNYNLTLPSYDFLIFYNKLIGQNFTLFIPTYEQTKVGG